MHGRGAANYESWANKDIQLCVQYGGDRCVCTVSGPAELTMGMTKNEVVESLGVYPYDILNSAGGCECTSITCVALARVGQKDASRSWSSIQEPGCTQKALKNLIYFKGGGLASVLTDASETTLPHELACLVNGMADMCTNSVGWWCVRLHEQIGVEL